MHHKTPQQVRLHYRAQELPDTIEIIELRRELALVRARSLEASRRGDFMRSAQLTVATKKINARIDQLRDELNLSAMTTMKS